MDATKFWEQIRDAHVTHVLQDDLTSDCWLVQIEGVSACEKCPDRDTDSCGGGKSLAASQQRRGAK